MTIPTPITPAEQFRADMLRSLDEIREELRAELESMRAELAQIRAGLTTASQPAPAVGPIETITETATHIDRESHKGRTYYRILCGQYTQHGIKIWPEYFPVVGIDPNALTWVDDRAKIDPPIRVTIEMKTYTKDGEIKTGPRRIIGRA